MPIAIGVDLEKDGARGILRGISGNGKRAKGLKKSRRWRMGHDKKSFFSMSNDCWQAGVQSQQLSFLVQSKRG